MPFDDPTHMHIAHAALPRSSPRTLAATGPLAAVSTPDNGAAEGCQVDVLMVATQHSLVAAQRRVSGPMRISRSGGALQRLRARHAGRAPMAGPERTSAIGTGDEVNEGRTVLLGAASAQGLTHAAHGKTGSLVGPRSGTISPPSAKTLISTFSQPRKK